MTTILKSLVSGAVAIGAIAGIGLASSPAQAGTFTLTITNTTVEDTEFGGGGEDIWKTFPLGFPTGTVESSTHGVAGIDGWDNPEIGFELGSGFTSATIKIEYFGSGTAAQTNDFFWVPGDSPFGPKSGTQPPDDSFGKVLGDATRVLTASGKLDFSFLAGTTPPTTIENGDPYDPEDPKPHYFATIDGTRGTGTTSPSGEVVYLGLSDRGRNDDDAADYVVRLTVVRQDQVKSPEPATMLGLLAVGSLGVALKRKKQEG